jgi:hypothetical protein
MDSVPNLADPTVEPTDEELEGLARRAFAHVRADHEASLIRLRQEIARERELVLAALAQGSFTAKK